MSIPLNVRFNLRVPPAYGLVCRAALWPAMAVRMLRALHAVVMAGADKDSLAPALGTVNQRTGRGNTDDLRERYGAHGAQHNGDEDVLHGTLLHGKETRRFFRPSPIYDTCANLFSIHRLRDRFSRFADSCASVRTSERRVKDTFVRFSNYFTSFLLGGVYPTIGDMSSIF